MLQKKHLYFTLSWAWITSSKTFKKTHYWPSYWFWYFWCCDKNLQQQGNEKAFSSFANLLSPFYCYFYRCFLLLCCSTRLIKKYLVEKGSICGNYVEAENVGGKMCDYADKWGPNADHIIPIRRRQPSPTHPFVPRGPNGPPKCDVKRSPPPRLLWTSPREGRGGHTFLLHLFMRPGRR